MGYKAHVATRYQVEFEDGGYPIEEFEGLVKLLRDQANALGITWAIWTTGELDDCWEFDRDGLEQVKKKLNPRASDDNKKLFDFIEHLLSSGDPENSVVRVEAW